MSHSARNKHKRNKGTYPVNKTEIMAGMRKSVVAVLSKTDNYKELIGNPTVVSDIAEAVFSSIYKKEGSIFFVRNKDNFSNMIENIMFNTEKVCQVSETKKQITKAAEVISSGCTETVTFDVLSANVTDKLDNNFSKDLDFFESKFKEEVDSVVYAGSDLSLKELPARKDLLYLDLILVAAGTNRNKDTVPAEELESRYLTLIGMPLVEEHEPQAIRGVFFDSKIIRIKPGKEQGVVKIVKKGGRIAVRAKAYVYKNRFPREAYTLKNRQENGMLRYSVELAFGKAECGVCGNTYSTSDKYCEHLLLRHSVKDPMFSRIVRDIYFIGGAYTTNPAEKSAVSIEVYDPTDDKSNKTAASCVITIDDTGKVADENDYSQENTEKIKAEEGTKPLNPNGGQRMYKYDSVEDLLASPEVNTLIEASVANILTEERDGFEASLNTLEEEKASYMTKLEELEATLAATEEKLTDVNKTVASMEQEKRISDTILDLQNAGYSFASDEELKTFTNQIADLSDEQSTFIVDMMKKTIVAKEEGSDPETKDDKAGDTANASDDSNEDKDDSLKASQNADANASVTENKTLLSIRQGWVNRIDEIKNPKVV